MRLWDTLQRVSAQVGRRYRQLRSMWKVGGVQYITDRARVTLSESLATPNMLLPVDRADVRRAEFSTPYEADIPELHPGQLPTINWVTIPAGPRSGGHTTMFRIIRYLEDHGYTNRLYFYNVYHADLPYYEEVVRSYYGFSGMVASIDDGMEDAHAVMATSWPTAYPVFNARSRGKRFYFVQDFEPFFYPVGSLSVLAENTYRMGFHAITAGRWLAQKLSTEFGMEVDFFEFGSDTGCYERLDGSQRSGIVFYARRESARRGFELGLMAIEILARKRPDLEIHVYGSGVGRVPFPVTDHGRVSPRELNHIYNRCFAGLSLSLTNVSLVPHEMLAAGCIPVVNEADHNRMVLDNALVRYAAPNPSTLAAELVKVVEDPDFEVLSRAAANSVRGRTWDDAGAAVASILHRSLNVSTYQHTNAGVVGSFR